MLVSTSVDEDDEEISDVPSPDVPDPTPEQLARAVRQRRAELRLSQEDVRRTSGLSITTIGKIERGDPDIVVQKATMRRLDVALRWPVGTAESWYDGPWRRRARPGRRRPRAARRRARRRCCRPTAPPNVELNDLRRRAAEGIPNRRRRLEQLVRELRNAFVPPAARLSRRSDDVEVARQHRLEQRRSDRRRCADRRALAAHRVSDLVDRGDLAGPVGLAGRLASQRRARRPELERGRRCRR